MSGALVTRAAVAPPGLISDAEIDRLWRLAQILAASQRYPDAKEAPKAMAVMLMGHDLGLTPTQALTGIHIVEGKPQMAAVLLARLIRERGYDFKRLEHTEEKCSIQFYGPNGQERGIVDFTMDDARKAGLIKARGNWEKWPKNMLWARCMSNGAKWEVSEVFGGMPVYTEADDFNEIARVPNLAEGNGDGSEPGWGTMPIPLVGEVEKIIRRAEKLGHGALANRASVQQIVGGFDEQETREWVAERMAELTAMKASEVREAVEGQHVVEGTAVEERPEANGTPPAQAPPAEPTFPEATGKSDVPSTWPGVPPSVTDPANAKVVGPTAEKMPLPWPGARRIVTCPICGSIEELSDTPCTNDLCPSLSDEERERRRLEDEYGQERPQEAAQAPATATDTPPATAPQEPAPRRRRRAPTPTEHTITVPAQGVSTGPQTQSQANAGEPQAPASDPEDELDLFSHGDG